MRHAREDYNGRIVDLLEPSLFTLLTGVQMLAEELRACDPESPAYRINADISTYEEHTERLASLAKCYTDKLVVLQNLGVTPIPDTEPVFLVRAQDALSYSVVSTWATLNDKFDGDAALSASAEVHAGRMAAWPVKKMADIRPETQRVPLTVENPL